MADPITPPEVEETTAGSKTFTQEDLDRIVAERLRRERDKHSDYDELKAKAGKLDELEAANKSELEKLNERLTATDQRAANAEQALIRANVAAAKGLTPGQAKRLAGATQEELEADADELLETFKSSRPDPTTRPRPNLRGGADPTEPVEETDPFKLASAIRVGGF